VAGIVQDSYGSLLVLSKAGKVSLKSEHYSEEATPWLSQRAV
jgi:hypothetical protein